MPIAVSRSCVALSSTCRELAFVSAVGKSRRQLRRRSRCRADSDQNGGDALSDRLKAAEAESAALRKQLAAAREARGQVLYRENHLANLAIDRISLQAGALSSILLVLRA